MNRIILIVFSSLIDLIVSLRIGLRVKPAPFIALTASQGTSFTLGIGWATLEQMKVGLRGISRALEDAAL